MVFVIDENKQPLAPCHPARARKLLKAGRAKVFRHFPFTIILQYSVSTGPSEADYSSGTDPGPESSPETVIRLDPGSRHTGLAVTCGDRVLFLMQIDHKLTIQEDMKKRAAYRRNRRARKTRYRKARFNNRRKKEDFLVPTLRSRIQHVLTWVQRIMRVCHVDRIEYELVNFDTQMLMDPDIKGTEYQEGPLFGTEMRAWLLQTFGHVCQYCGEIEGRMEWEHIIPRSRNGSNSVKNATLACHDCNKTKGRMTAKEWKEEILTHKKLSPLDRRRLNGIEKVLNQNYSVPLADAAITNSIRWRLRDELKRATGLPVQCCGGRYTKRNRKQLGLVKDHCIDAACVGKSIPDQFRFQTDVCLIATAKGRGKHYCTRPDKNGFPRISLPKQKIIHGFRTGDIVKATMRKGKYQGTYIGRVVCRTRGRFAISGNGKSIPSISYKDVRLVQKADGYEYSQKKIFPWEDPT